MFILDRQSAPGADSCWRAVRRWRASPPHCRWASNRAPRRLPSIPLEKCQLSYRQLVNCPAVLLVFPHHFLLLPARLRAQKIVPAPLPERWGRFTFPGGAGLGTTSQHPHRCHAGQKNCTPFFHAAPPHRSHTYMRITSLSFGFVPVVAKCSLLRLHMTPVPMYCVCIQRSF